MWTHFHRPSSVQYYVSFLRRVRTRKVEDERRGRGRVVDTYCRVQRPFTLFGSCTVSVTCSVGDIVTVVRSAGSTTRSSTGTLSQPTLSTNPQNLNQVNKTFQKVPSRVRVFKDLLSLLRVRCLTRVTHLNSSTGGGEFGTSNEKENSVQE